MSLSVAGQLAAGEDPTLEAAIVKDLGNSFEQALPRAVQALVDDGLDGRTTATSRACSRYLLQTVAVVLAARRDARDPARHRRARAGLR